MFSLVALISVLVATANAQFPTAPPMLGLDPACQKVVNETLNPLYTDPNCPVTKVFTGNTSTVADLEKYIPQMCAPGCTSKIQRAILDLGSSQCKDNSVVNLLFASSYYYTNYYCIKSGDTYCLVDQAKKLDAAKVAANASITAWPKESLCSDCTASQIAFSQNEKIAETAQFASELTKNVRTNPSLDKDNIKKICGEPYYNDAVKKPVSVVVDLSENAGGDTKKNSGENVKMSVAALAVAAVSAMMVF
ncbi:hypothetical protein BKA69DRAFT_1039529 [Paraphysoderma sedebokerense]|nr:hypothetical protein BKA69DRAFT_1039529 [Paraphysoderma sedebokerense]